MDVADKVKISGKFTTSTISQFQIILSHAQKEAPPIVWLRLQINMESALSRYCQIPITEPMSETATDLSDVIRYSCVSNEGR